MANDTFLWSADMTEVSLSLRGLKTSVPRSLSGASDRAPKNSGAGYWEISFSTRKRHYNEYRELFAFLIAQRGQYGEFDFVINQFKNTRSSYGGNILVNGASQATSEIAVDGMTVSTNQVLRMGDFVQLGNNKKVYMIVQDLKSDGAGEGILYLHAPVVTAPNNNDAIVFRNVIFNVANTEDDNTLDMDTVLRCGWDLTFAEAWN